MILERMFLSSSELVFVSVLVIVGEASWDGFGVFIVVVCVGSVVWGGSSLVLLWVVMVVSIVGLPGRWWLLCGAVASKCASVSNWVGVCVVPVGLAWFASG